MNLSRRQTLTGGLALLALPTLASAQSANDQLRAGTELNNIYENLLKDGHGFSKKGLPENLPVVVLVMDTQCSWCSKLWQAIQPLSDTVKFILFPVGVLNDESVSQGAAILSAPNPWMMMTRNERHFKDEDFRGIKTASMIIPQKFRNMVWQNAKLFRRAGGTSVPMGVFKSADGKYTPILSGVTTEELAKIIGVPVPKVTEADNKKEE